MNSLPGIIMQFRTKKVAFMCDICAFFHQVHVDPRDADVFRYFWFRDEELKEIDLYRFKAHIFGSGASSVVTSFVLRHHAERIKHNYPKNVHETIRHFFYVDDGSGGADSVEEAIALKENLKKALAEGGFTLSKWKSNEKALLEGEEMPSTKSLGKT